MNHGRPWRPALLWAWLFGGLGGAAVVTLNLAVVPRLVAPAPGEGVAAADAGELRTLPTQDEALRPGSTVQPTERDEVAAATPLTATAEKATVGADGATAAQAAKVAAAEAAAKAAAAQEAAAAEAAATESAAAAAAAKESAAAEAAAAEATAKEAAAKEAAAAEAAAAEAAAQEAAAAEAAAAEAAAQEAAAAEAAAAEAAAKENAAKEAAAKEAAAKEAAAKEAAAAEAAAKEAAAKRVAAAAAANTQPGASQAAPSPVVISYETNAFELNSGHEAALRPLAESLLAREECRLAVHCHADRLGEAQINEYVSRARCRAVTAWAAGLGLAAKRVRAASHGERDTPGPDDVSNPAWRVSRVRLACPPRR